MNKMIFKRLSSITSLVIPVLLSSIAMAEIPATAQQHLGTTANNNPYTQMNAAHKGIGNNKPTPFWSEEQQQAAAYEAKLLEEIKNNPDGKNAYRALANLYLANNKTRKAIGAYQEAINHDSTNAKLFAGLSIAYLHQSKYSMAKAMADQAIKLDPNMKHAMKIKEYIIAKEEVIAQASKVSDMPEDSTHKKGTH